MPGTKNPGRCYRNPHPTGASGTWNYDMFGEYGDLNSICFRGYISVVYCRIRRDFNIVFGLLHHERAYGPNYILC